MNIPLLKRPENKKGVLTGDSTDNRLDGHQKVNPPRTRDGAHAFKAQGNQYKKPTPTQEPLQLHERDGRQTASTQAVARKQEPFDSLYTGGTPSPRYLTLALCNLHQA